MNKIIIFLIFGILFSSFAFAEPSFFFKANKDVDLKLPCINDGAPCSAVATCNITIDDPDSNTIVDNQLMTNQNSYHNYTLSETSKLGTYQAIVFCIDGTDSDFTTFSFATTENGNTQDGLTFIVAISIITLFCIIIALNLGKDFIWIKVVLLVFSLFYVFLIPAFFIIKNTKMIFYKTFTGMLILLTIFIFLWLITWVLKKFEVIG